MFKMWWMKLSIPRLVLLIFLIAWRVAWAKRVGEAIMASVVSLHGKATVKPEILRNISACCGFYWSDGGVDDNCD